MVTWILRLQRIPPIAKKVHYDRFYLPVDHWIGSGQLSRRGGGARQNDSFSNKCMARCVWLTWNKKIDNILSAQQS